MNYSLTTRPLGNFTVIEISGRLTLGAAADAFADAVTSTLQSGNHNILVNLEGLTFLDSAGLGKLLAGLKSAAASGGRFWLVNAGPRVQGLMKLTATHSLFTFFSTEAAALDSLNSEL